MTSDGVSLWRIHRTQSLALEKAGCRTDDSHGGSVRPRYIPQCRTAHQIQIWPYNRQILAIADPSLNIPDVTLSVYCSDDRIVKVAGMSVTVARAYKGCQNQQELGNWSCWSASAQP